MAVEGLSDRGVGNLIEIAEPDDQLERFAYDERDSAGAIRPIALTIAGFVWARRFAAEGRGLWSAYSVISVVIFVVSFAALGQVWLTLALVLTA